MHHTWFSAASLVGKALHKDSCPSPTVSHSLNGVAEIGLWVLAQACHVLWFELEGWCGTRSSLTSDTCLCGESKEGGRTMWRTEWPLQDLVPPMVRVLSGKDGCLCGSFWRDVSGVNKQWLVIKHQQINVCFINCLLCGER